MCPHSALPSTVLDNLCNLHKCGAADTQPSENILDPEQSIDLTVAGR